MPANDLPLLILLAVLILGAVFLAAAEASLLRVSAARARSEASGGGRRELRLLHLVEHLPQVLNLILLLALLSQIGAATVTGILAQRWFGNVAVTIASVFLTIFLYVYAEALPKTFAVRHPMRTARFVAGPVALLERFLRPLVRVLVWIADIQMPGRGVTISSAVTEEELRFLALEAADEGEITESDRTLIERVFRFGDRRVDDIMVPRPDIVAVGVDASIAEALEVALESGHRRLPVHAGDLEHVVGVVKLHDLITARGTGADLASLAFQPLVVPESKRVTGLLTDMQDQGIHLAIVVDEYGVTVGMVTIEDVAEEMLGTISDAETAPGLERVREGLWLASGSMPVEDLAIELGITIPEGDWNTVAGMMLGISGEILDTGSVVEVAGHRLRVASVRGRRITGVEIEARPDTDR